MDEVIGKLIALMDQRIVALDKFDIWLTFIKWSDVRIVEPDVWARSPNIGQKLTGVIKVQVPNSRR